MSVEEYDLVILGGGTGSTVAAWTFAAPGQRVAVIERRYIGGSCPNIACLPSKNIIHSAKIASYVRRSEEFGVSKREFSVNMHAVRERKRSMVSGGMPCIWTITKRAERNSSSVQIAMLAGLPYTALRDAILTHPTLGEGLIGLFSSAPSAKELRS